MLACLDFDNLRRANLVRCEDAYHPLTAWSLTDWAAALAGEVGEACNVVKKLRRLDTVTGGQRSRYSTPDDDADNLHYQLERELADTIIYCDLLAARAGIDLGEAVRAKFNLTSESVNSAVRL